MANIRRNYICITASGKVEKHISNSIGQLIDAEKSTNQFISTTRIELQSKTYKDFEELE